MNRRCNRRHFLQTTLTAAAALGFPAWRAQADTASAFSFILLGDLHYDRLGLHDMSYLQANYPGDISQIQNYTRITATILPRLFSSVRQTIATLNAQAQTPVAFVVQTGDLVEGLCGSQALATRQCQEALALVRNAQLGAPFFFAKGNHDITGTGAAAAYQSVFFPFLSQQTAGFKRGANVRNAYYAVEYGNSLFCIYDGYDVNSLSWLQATLAGRTAQNCFVLIHQPVVPYGARSNWIIYYGSDSTNVSRRTQLLSLLGGQNVYVLGGHIHKFSALVRQTPNNGKFAQLGVCSVINQLDVQASHVLNGIQYYDCTDQLATEPTFDPSTQQQRCDMYTAESPYVTQFQYADLPGYTLVRVNGATVEADIYSGAGRKLWQTIPLSQSLFG